MESQAKEEPVYNLEVEYDHCYRVGREGLTEEGRQSVVM